MFGPGEDFFAYLRDTFDLLYEEGAERPRMGKMPDARSSPSRMARLAAPAQQRTRPAER